MGQRIAAYTVTETLGRGSYGEVLAAVHDVIGRDVAIKILHAKWSDDADAVRRFVAEARAVNAVRHPNIVDVVDFGTLEDGRHYHVMERLRGESLRARLDSRAPLSLTEAIPILRAVAAALDAAHDAGIVHRDVKPENVFLHRDGERETVKLIDFGLAKLARTDVAPTQTGVILGTPAYMAPEQCRGATVDRRTDSYAFGVLAYELLTGEVPLRGADPVATLLAHVQETPRAPSRLTRLPALVDKIVMPLLGKSPDDRPDRLAPVVDALEACIGKPARRRHSVVPIVLGLAALGGGAIALGLAAREPDAAPQSAPVTTTPALIDAALPESIAAPAHPALIAVPADAPPMPRATSPAKPTRPNPEDP